MSLPKDAKVEEKREESGENDVHRVSRLDDKETAGIMTERKIQEKKRGI